MIVTAYTRLVINCHKEELGNRLELSSGGFFRQAPSPMIPEAYRERETGFALLHQPLAIGRDSVDLASGEVRGTV